MVKVKIIFPFVFLFLLLGMLGREIFYAKPSELPSALVGKPIPQFILSDLFNPQSTISDKDLPNQVILINIWATWCYACTVELPLLHKIKNEYHIPIYGINYKDDSESAIQWLKQNGNPYTLIGLDKTGDTAIDFGAYGTPETFIISPHKKIIYRHVGLLNQKAWDHVLYPLIKQYEMRL